MSTSKYSGEPLDPGGYTLSRYQYLLNEDGSYSIHVRRLKTVILGDDGTLRVVAYGDLSLPELRAARKEGRVATVWTLEEIARGPQAD